MKKIILIILILLFLPLFAEKKELQFFIGTGVYFPTGNMETDDKTTLVFKSWTFPLEAQIGLTERIWLGAYCSYTTLSDTNIKNYTTDKGEKGTLWFDYERWNFDLQAKFILLAGYPVSINAIGGLGGIVDTWRNQSLYLNNQDAWSNDFDNSNYSEFNWNYQGGLDITYRVWWNILAKVEFLYNTSKNTTGYEANIYLGYSHFPSSYKWF